MEIKYIMILTLIIVVTHCLFIKNNTVKTESFTGYVALADSHDYGSSGYAEANQLKENAMYLSTLAADSVETDDSDSKRYVSGNSNQFEGGNFENTFNFETCG